MSKIVFVEKDDCTSCSLCSDTAPGYFRLDDDDLAESHNEGENVQSAQIDGDAESQVQEVIDDCPAECIHWK